MSSRGLMPGEKPPLGNDERRALHAAAAASGYEKEFGDLLCALAEIYGFEMISKEFEKVKAEMKALGLGGQTPSR